MKILYWVAPFYTLLVCYGSLSDSAPIKEAPFQHFDKVLHFTAYAIMFVCWYLFFYHRFLERQPDYKYDLHTILSDWSRVIAIAAIVFSFVIGALIEFAQALWSNNRQMDPLDAVANLAGIVIAALVMHLISRFIYTR
ncbi:VanZ family protein [Nonlabens ponticola]|uniref:VanZ-like domain-containing protein n=1 Tax=Nonlabens ponticola TaxID=2496866 RepID=A0A3S9MUS4_9FLAO|nr:VanZ family protein [Nonlabens ponticola]AZQ42903.1 hypothetical protein EJ995_01120 [Nonlabens ponticola]